MIQQHDIFFVLQNWFHLRLNLRRDYGVEFYLAKLLIRSRNRGVECGSNTGSDSRWPTLLLYTIQPYTWIFLGQIGIHKSTKIWRKYVHSICIGLWLRVKSLLPYQSAKLLDVQYIYFLWITYSKNLFTASLAGRHLVSPFFQLLKVRKI